MYGSMTIGNVAEEPSAKNISLGIDVGCIFESFELVRRLFLRKGVLAAGGDFRSKGFEMPVSHPRFRLWRSLLTWVRISFFVAGSNVAGRDTLTKFSGCIPPSFFDLTWVLATLQIRSSQRMRQGASIYLLWIRTSAEL
jgi:hypothetical protein